MLVPSQHHGAHPPGDRAFPATKETKGAGGSKEASREPCRMLCARLASSMSDHPRLIAYRGLTMQRPQSRADSLKARDQHVSRPWQETAQELQRTRPAKLQALLLFKALLEHPALHVFLVAIRQQPRLIRHALVVAA